MSAATNISALGRALKRGSVATRLEREKEAIAATDPFGPTTALTWWYARLRPADSEGAPKLTRLKESVTAKWHESGQPLTSPESRPVFPDLRANRGSRAEVRSMCRDEMDCIFAFPYGAIPFGEELIKNPTFCRPILRRHRRRDERHAKAYTASLEDFVCTAAAAENKRLREELCAIYAELDKE